MKLPYSHSSLWLLLDSRAEKARRLGWNGTMASHDHCCSENTTALLTIQELLSANQSLQFPQVPCGSCTDFKPVPSCPQIQSFSSHQLTRSLSFMRTETLPVPLKSKPLTSQFSFWHTKTQEIFIDQKVRHTNTNFCWEFLEMTLCSLQCKWFFPSLTKG